MGGLAYHLAQGSQEGTALSRYLSITQRIVYGHELYSMGVVTHLVGEHAYDPIANSIAQSIASTDEDSVKARYVSPVDVSYLSDLIDTTCITDPVSSDIDIDWDVYSHPVWQKASLVPDSIENTMVSVVGSLFVFIRYIVDVLVYSWLIELFCECVCPVSPSDIYLPIPVCPVCRRQCMH